jgi:hypothetical protein
MNKPKNPARQRVRTKRADKQKYSVKRVKATGHPVGPKPR